jgi:hypothetical protein
MQRFWLMTVLLLLAAAPSFAQGPRVAPLPENPCGAARLSGNWIANQVGTDAGGPACPSPGSGCAETMVVCTHRGKTERGKDEPLDVVVEMFTAAGAPAGSASVCGVLPGASVAFVTDGRRLPPPYVGTLIGGPPVAPLGSLRILSAGSRNRLDCDVTLIDVSSIAMGMTLVGPASTQGVKITKFGGAQQGD